MEDLGVGEKIILKF